MIHVHGNGGHAKVVREIVALVGGVEWEGNWFVIAIGDNADRKKEAAMYSGGFAVLIHPRSCVSASAEIKDGTVICAGALIDPAVKIGRHVIINAGAVVTHDCVIEDYAHIAPGVHLCGGVHVGEGALVGVGSCAVPGAKIPAWSLVKAGSVVK